MGNSNGADFESKISADPAGFEAGVNRAIKSVTNLHSEIDKQFKSIGNITSSLTGAFAKMAAVFAGGGVLKEFIQGTNEWNSSAAVMAKQLGISTERSSVLSVALKRIGVDSETYTSAAEKLSKQIQGNAQAFDVLGVKVRDASGAYRPVTELMGEVNQKLAAIKNPIEQNIAGQQIYGKGWSEVRQILKLTAQGMAEAETRARELGLIVGPEGAAMTRQYTEQMRDLALVSKSLELQMGNQLLPTFTNFGQIMNENVKPIAQAFAITMQTVAVLGANVAFVFQGVGRDLGAIGAQIGALMTLNFSGFTAIGDAVKEDAARARAELDLFEQWVLGLAAPAKRDTSNSGNEGRNDTGPKYKFKEKVERAGAEKSQMGDWEAKLSEQKLAIAEAARLDGTFHEMSKEQEREYWQNILRTIDRNSHDGLSVRKKIADEGLSIDKQAYEARIETLKLEREELELNFSRRTEVAVKAYQETVARYGQESKEAIKAYEVVLAEHRKYVEQKRALDLVASESRRRLVLAGVEFERGQMQQELADGTISKLEALELERQFEEKLFAIRQAGLNERKGLVDPAKDPVALAQINGEVELLELQHQNRLKEISAAARRERQSDIESTARTIQQSWAGLISQLAKGVITFGSFIKGIFQSVANAVIDTLAQLAAKYVVDLILKRVLSKTAAAAQITDNAAVAGAAATASAAAIPFVGWAMAPEAGAAAYGSALAYMAGLSSAAGGFDIPGNVNPIVQAHAKEMILPAKHADVIRTIAESNGIGSAGISSSQGAPIVLRERSSNEFFIANRKELVTALKSARRDFAF